MPDPVPVLALKYAPASADDRPRWRAVARICLVLAWMTCLVAAFLIAQVDVESVLVTGPMLFTFGLGSLLAGALTRQRLPLFLGVAHCSVCILFFFLVLMLEWSPQQARTPFIIMGSLYTLGAAGPTWTLVSRGRGLAPSNDDTRGH